MSRTNNKLIFTLNLTKSSTKLSKNLTKRKEVTYYIIFTLKSNLTFVEHQEFLKKRKEHYRNELKAAMLLKQ